MLNQSDRAGDNVLIIGGGPAGLATALMLAKRGWTNVTVLEQRIASDYYEPDKSFNYLIDGRGQDLTDLLGLTEELSQISVPSTEFYLTQVKHDGSSKTSKLAVVDPNRKAAYWIPRSAFVSLLDNEIQRNWQGKITVLFNAKCIEIRQIANTSDEVENLEAIAQINTKEIIKFSPQFLLGCDGIGSIVRSTLNEWDASNSDQFAMKLFPSPSTGLRYKVLTLPPQFPLDNNGKEHSISEMAYAIRSQIKDPKQKISLGLLPVKDLNQPRTANIITQPGHGIWELKSSGEAYNFLETSFPQLPIRQIISTEEIERFVTSTGGTFPAPQYCPQLYFLLKAAPEKLIGIALLGDAVHCFPPDIGQGVNSALQDVYLLNEALSQTNDNIASALPLYQSLRSPDLEPLIRLAQTSFPWQYNQDQIGRFLWSINFFMRLALNRVLPFLYSAPSFFLLQNHQLSYRQIWQKVQVTTRNLYLLLLLIICLLFAFGIKFYT
ncbi:MAG: FAD-dependent monooxygenase [Methylacidiphilales bacterium]|nr:FAD-dependent monooxygenase [Candidatus Methylacidiphilales bacterium]NJR19041.1 FAD-dependent monooxygenase [Calothrix sp. CSU_2_0]